MRLGLTVQEEPGCGEPVNVDDPEEKTGGRELYVVSAFEPVEKSC